MKCKKCNKRAVFGFQNSKLREYCVTHKLEGMVDISHNKLLLYKISKK